MEWNPDRRRGGAVVGMGLAPYAYRGGFNDSECSVIVRIAIGLPAIAIGAAAGGIIDRLHSRAPLTWHSVAYALRSAR